MNSIPLVSICIPVYNPGKYFEETLKAILNLDYEHYEVVIVNDHTTDGSINILNTFHHKIKLLTATSNGAAAARNQAYLNCKGDYIVFFDADDLIPTNFLSSQVDKALKNKNDVIISKWGRFFDDLSNFKEDGNIIKHDLSFHEWIVKYWTFNGHMTPPGRILIPRHIIEKSGLWNEKLSLNDDLDFYARVFSHTKKIIYNDDVSLYYRSGIGGLSSKVKGYKYQLSNFKAIEGATSLALSMYPYDVNVKLACANMWQLFVYDAYPMHKDLISAAEKNISTLGGANFNFRCGGSTKFLSTLFGWKLAKRVKLTFNKL